MRAQMDPHVVMKREFLDQQSRLCDDPDMKLSGNDWYVQEACRAVNQALGRVIRHKNDYGAMILCDERFASESNRKCLSAWLQPSWHVCQSFGPVAAELGKFFNAVKNDPELQRAVYESGSAVDSPNTLAGE
jgi:regulator of telomere elongation helicase 1